MELVYYGKRMKRIIFLLAFFSAFGLALVGCSGRNPSFFPASEDDAVSAEAQVRKPRRAMADFRVVLLAGEDFAARPAVASFLLSEYGDAGDGGMLVRLPTLRGLETLPEDSILLLLGAPDSVVRDLVRLRDSVPRLSVVSLFSAAEALPLEEACDLVIDLAAGGELLADETSVSPSALPDAELGFLLYTAALACDQAKGGEPPSGETSSAERGPAARKAAGLLPDALVRARSYSKNKSAGATWVFTPFVDPDTGLRSANHLVFSSAAGGGVSP